MGKKIHEPGKVEIQEISLITTSIDGKSKTISLRNTFVELNINEGIDMPFMQGNILIQEVIGLIELAPMIGEEQIKISFVSSSNGDFRTFTKLFDVRQITDVTRIADNTKQFVIHFITPEATHNNNTIVSRQFKGMYSHEIVADILQNDLKMSDTSLFHVEESKHTKDITLPAWHPMKVINYLKKTSVGRASESPSYVFFENDQKTVFATLTQMYKQEPIEVWKDEVDGGILDYDLGRMKDFESNHLFNVHQNLLAGMYGSRLVSSDILTKTIDVTDFSYDDQFKAMGHLDGQRSQPLIKNRGGDLYGGAHHIYSMNYGNEHIKDWLQDRASIMSQINHNIYTVTIGGSTNRSTGDVITLNLPSTALGSGKRVDKYLGGNYLITHITHRITTESDYIQTIEIAKDCFHNEVSND